MLRTPALCALVLVALASAGCNSATPSAPTSGHPPEKPKQESDLAYITLPKKAYQALGVRVQSIKMRDVQERITLTGWIMAKPGHEVIVTAPVAGYLRSAKNQTEAPVAGDRVQVGQELLILEPKLTHLEEIQLATLKRGIESELAKAKTSVQTATVDYQRVKDLHAQKLRSEQDVEQANKVLEHAKEDLAAALDKLKLFVTSDIPLKAPRAGAILALHASPGQYVAAAAPVVTIIDLQTPWLRVPVPEYDLPNVDPKESVTLTWKHANGAAPNPEGLRARPTGRVSQVDAQRHMADFWYELEPGKEAARFFKDQMMTVHVPISKTQPALVVPYAAVVYDTHGNAWIYLDRTKDDDKHHRFVRQRVQLGAPSGDGLVVRDPIGESERVVTNGAAVLFSREFHKTPVADEDDD